MMNSMKKTPTPKAKATTPVAPTQEGKQMLVNVVLDRSGSMNSCRSGTISGYNEYLGGLRADKDTEYFISLIQFDTDGQGPALTVSYTDKPLLDVPDLTLTTYEPRGMTPLYDAIGECIRRVDAKGRGVITVIITDGAENASREFTQATAQALIKSKEAEGWGFVFLGANIDAKSVGGSLGVGAQNAYNYQVGNEHQLYAAAAKGTAMRSSNIRSYGSVTGQSMAFLSAEQERSLMGASGDPVGTPSTSVTGGRQAAPPMFPRRRLRNGEWSISGDAPVSDSGKSSDGSGGNT